MSDFLKILMGAVLVNNFVLVKFLGICPFLGVSKKLNSSTGMAMAVTFVMVLATAVTWPIQTYLLAPYGIDYLQTIVFILVIAVLVQLVEIVLKKYVPALHRTLGVFLPLITTNCAVLGVCVLNIDEGYGYGISLVNALGAGIGFLVAMVIFAGIRGKMEDSDIPASFKGMPSVLVAASILSLAFMGFSGVIDGIFGG